MLRFSGVISNIELMLIVWKPTSPIISAVSRFLIPLAHIPFPQNPFISLTFLQVSHRLLFHSISQSPFPFLLAEQFEFFRSLEIFDCSQLYLTSTAAKDYTESVPLVSFCCL